MLRSSRNVAVASQTLCVVMMLALAQSACDRASLGDDNVCTLYRSSVSDPAARLHVATFDADENDAYNRENCEVARSLFQEEASAAVRYWCEAGRVRRTGFSD